MQPLQFNLFSWSNFGREIKLHIALTIDIIFVDYVRGESFEELISLFRVMGEFTWIVSLFRSLLARFFPLFDCVLHFFIFWVLSQLLEEKTPAFEPVLIFKLNVILKTEVRNIALFNIANTLKYVHIVLILLKGHSSDEIFGRRSFPIRKFSMEGPLFLKIWALKFS